MALISYYLLLTTLKLMVKQRWLTGVWKHI